ncbi:MAG: hypothetical protein VZR09_09430 [Candidatus Gastranaerophilaceae bacterium]|nr:hypothetical protein [Candidatus Gastranaerophilaceae bacterium]
MKVGIFKQSYDYAQKVSHNFRTKFYARPAVAEGGSVLHISSLNNGISAEEYTCDGIKESVRQLRRYSRALGIGFWDYIKANVIHNAQIISPGFFDVPISSVKRLASVPVKGRNRKDIVAQIDKVDFGEYSDGGVGRDIVYVIKNKEKQLGYVSIMQSDDSIVYINYLNTILGRKKYKNLEKILLQTVVEDCLRQGYVPKLKAFAENVSRFMGRGYNNKALYHKMGMQSAYPGWDREMLMSQDNVLAFLKKYVERNGEILNGTKANLDNFR